MNETNSLKFFQTSFIYNACIEIIIIMFCKNSFDVNPHTVERIRSQTGQNTAFSVIISLISHNEKCKK